MTLACVYRMTRPLRCFCGTVLQPQLATPLVIFAKPAGMRKSGLPVSPAGFQQQDLHGWVSAQAICQNATRGPSADDDVVVGHRSFPNSSKIVLRDMVRDAKRLRGDGQRWIDRGRRRQEGGVDDEQVRMVPGAAEGIERRGRGIDADANGPALMRRRPTVERSRKDDWVARRAQAILESLDEHLMGRSSCFASSPDGSGRRRP